jgi:hypothetical protein
MYRGKTYVYLKHACSVHVRAIVHIRTFTLADPRVFTSVLFLEHIVSALYERFAYIGFAVIKIHLLSSRYVYSTNRCVYNEYHMDEFMPTGLPLWEEQLSTVTPSRSMLLRLAVILLLQGGSVRLALVRPPALRPT